MLLTQKSEKSSVSQFSVLSSLGEEYTDNKYTIVENLQRGQTVTSVSTREARYSAVRFDLSS